MAYSFYDWSAFPAGVRFDPTDVQLIGHLMAKLEDEGYGEAIEDDERIGLSIGRSRKQHPQIDQFVPTLAVEDGICSVYPQELPGEPCV